MSRDEDAIMMCLQKKTSMRDVQQAINAVKGNNKGKTHHYAVSTLSVIIGLVECRA